MLNCSIAQNCSLRQPDDDGEDILSIITYLFISQVCRVRDGAGCGSRGLPGGLPQQKHLYRVLQAESSSSFGSETWNPLDVALPPAAIVRKWPESQVAKCVLLDSVISEPRVRVRFSVNITIQLTETCSGRLRVLVPAWY